MVGVKAQAIDIIHPGALLDPNGVDEEHGKDGSVSTVPWSDHSGLKCSFGLVEIG